MIKVKGNKMRKINWMMYKLVCNFSYVLNIISYYIYIGKRKFNRNIDKFLSTLDVIFSFWFCFWILIVIGICVFFTICCLIGIYIGILIYNY